MRTISRPRPRIAVLDDHDDTRELLHILLESEFSVAEFTEAAALLEAMKKENFAAIVADIMLPKLNGYYLVTTLRADPRFKNMPVIAVTALAMPADREKAMAAGFTEYLTKPVEPQDVIDAVWRHIGGRADSSAWRGP